MPHGRLKFHRGWHEGVLRGEGQLGLEEAALVEGVHGADNENFPFKKVALVFESSTKPIHRVFAQLHELALQ